jgi:serine/threonine protein kinase
MFAKLTLEYMAPELKDGSGKKASQESDMYACGILVRKLMEKTGYGSTSDETVRRAQPRNRGGP